MSVEFLAPVGAFIGGCATAVGIWAAGRKARALKRWQDALVRDEFLGHKGIEGIPDKPSMSARLERVELVANQLSEQFTPNHGTSALDKINATHHLAEEAVATATQVKSDLDQYRKDHP